MMIKVQLSMTPSYSNLMPRFYDFLAEVQTMVSCLFEAKLLPEPVLTYCQVDLKGQMSVKFE